MSTLDDIKARVEGHTPGPWDVASGDWGTTRKNLTMLWAGQRDENDFIVSTAFAESRADAELIATAPKLLAALEAVEELCALAETEVDGRRRTSPSFIHPDAIRQMIAEALS